jgi:hypothetical protein
LLVLTMTTSDTWRNRPLTVRTLERCDSCSTLKEDIKQREAANYYPRWSVSLKSCAGCFETAKAKAMADAKSESYGYC